MLIWYWKWFCGPPCILFIIRLLFVYSWYVCVQGESKHFTLLSFFDIIPQWLWIFKMHFYMPVLCPYNFIHCEPKKSGSTFDIITLDKHTHTYTHTHTTVLQHCPGLPGWAGTRRNIHPLTPLLLINHPYYLPLSTANRSIILAQSTYLAVSLHNL